MAEILSTLSADGLKGTPTNGGARYVLMSTWESAQQGVHTLSDNSVLECFGDDYGDTNGALRDSCNFSGWTTSPTATVTIRPAAGSEHNGIQRKNGGTGFAMVAISTIAYAISLGSNGADAHITVKGIELDGDAINVGSNPEVITIHSANGGTGQLFLEELICDNTFGLYDDNNVVISARYSNSTIRNTVIVSRSTGIEARVSAGSTTIENVTIDSTGLGQYGVLNNASTTCTNVVCINQANKSWLGTLGTNSNNASEDANAPGTGSVTGISAADGVDFTSPSTNTYTIVSAGNLDGAVNPGADLSGSFNIDIAGNARSAPWEIGAWEIQGAPAGATLDTPTVTVITQTTATIGCSTDTAGGTLYWTVTESATATAADIKAGTGVDSGNFVPGGTGPQTVGATGLTADTAYYHHWVQVT